MCGSLFFSLESCNAHRLVILVNFSLSSWEKDYQKSQTGSNLCFIPTPSQALLKSNNYWWCERLRRRKKKEFKPSVLRKLPPTSLFNYWKLEYGFKLLCRYSRVSDLNISKDQRKKASAILQCIKKCTFWKYPCCTNTLHIIELI